MATAPLRSPRRDQDPLFTRQFLLACAVHFTGGMALSFYILFPLFIHQLGGDELAIGIYTGLAGAAAVLVRLPVGHFLDTQGRWRVLLGAGLVHTASWLGFTAIGALGPAAVVLVIAHGLAGGALFASYFTYASDIVPISRRAEGVAMFGIGGMLPNGLGPLLGESLIHRSGFGAFFVAAAGFAALSMTLAMLLPETLRHQRSSAGGPRVRAPLPYLRILPVLTTTFLFGIGVNSIFTFLAPFAYVQGRGSVGSFFLAYALTAVAVRVFTGRVPDRVGLRRVLVPALALFAIGLVLIPHVLAAAPFIAVGCLCGAGHGYAFPILNVLTVEKVSEAQRGRAVSWFTAMLDLGSTIGNPILGAVADTAGYTVMFTAAGAGMIASLLVAIWDRR